MKTITATLPAFVTPAYYTAKNLQEMTPEDAIARVQIYPKAIDGWIQVGTAQVTLTFLDDAAITAGQIAMLQAAKRKVQADCEVALNQLEGQIQSLLAIESK